MNSQIISHSDYITAHLIMFKTYSQIGVCWGGGLTHQNFSKRPVIRYPSAFRLDHIGESERFCPLLFAPPPLFFFNQTNVAPSSRQHHLSNCEFRFGLEILFTPVYLACVALLVNQHLKSSLERGGWEMWIFCIIHGEPEHVPDYSRLLHWPGNSVSDKCKNLVQCQVARTVILFHSDMLRSRSS